MKNLFLIGCLILVLIGLPLHACDYGLPRQSSVQIYGAAAAPSCTTQSTTVETPASTVLRVERALYTPQPVQTTVEVQRVFVPAAPLIYQQAQASYSYGTFQRSFATYGHAARAEVFVQRAPRAKVFIQQAPVVKVQRQAVAVKAPAANVTVIQKRGLFGRTVTKVKTN